MIGKIATVNGASFQFNATKSDTQKQMNGRYATKTDLNKQMNGRLTSRMVKSSVIIAKRMIAAKNTSKCKGKPPVTAN